MSERQLSNVYKLVAEVNRLKLELFGIINQLRENEVSITDTRTELDKVNITVLSSTGNIASEDDKLNIDGSIAMTGDLDLGGNGIQTTNDLLTETELENIHDRLGALDQNLNTTDAPTFGDITISDATPVLTFADTDGDNFSVIVNSNTFAIRDGGSSDHQFFTYNSGNDILLNPVGGNVKINDNADSDVTLFDFWASGRTFVIGATADNVDTTIHGDLTISGDIFAENATTFKIIAGGSDASSGANLLLYGETHATQAFDWAIRDDTNNNLSFDYSTQLLTVGRTTRTTDVQITGNIGFYDTTPTSQSAAYTPTNVSTDRAYDANSTTMAEIADVLGTLIADLQATGLIG